MKVGGRVGVRVRVRVRFGFGFGFGFGLESGLRVMGVSAICWKSGTS